MEDFLEYAESQFEPQSMFEFDLGMCLAALVSLIDEPEQWYEVEQEFFMCKAEDLLEAFKAKYPDWMEEYARRKKE
jgi:hypothetical protein